MQIHDGKRPYISPLLRSGTYQWGTLMMDFVSLQGEMLEVLWFPCRSIDFDESLDKSSSMEIDRDMRV
jgi:hypothetical protein